MPQQLFFDLDFATTHTSAEAAHLSRKRLGLQRAVMRWIECQKDAPTGAGVNVVTRISRLRADVAAFWSVPKRNPHAEGPSQVLVPARTMIIQCHPEREDCWPDCIKSREILPKLKALKAALAEEEEKVREEEPHLRATDTLFEEYTEWDYEHSENREYHRLKQAIEKMEHSLYHGTKFERIRSAQLADHLYLAVPKGVVEKSELADGWGLLWVDDDLNIEIAGGPEDRECLSSNRIHLVQNIAAASKQAALFALGIQHSGKDAVNFVKPPRGHRARQKLTFSDL